MATHGLFTGSRTGTRPDRRTRLLPAREASWTVRTATRCFCSVATQRRQRTGWSTHRSEYWHPQSTEDASGSW
jgi:hypothetical protein